MSVSLSNKKKKTILDICENALITSKVTIRYIARVLGKFFSSFLAVPLGRLHYRALERFKTEVLKEHEGNFHKIVIIPKSDLDDILWWKPTIPLSVAPIVRENPSVTVNTDASSFGWGACTENGRTGGQFNLEESECGINILELKAPLKSLCDSVKDSHILLKLDNTSAVAAINKVDSTQSLDMDHVVHKIWHWVISKNNWLSATHIAGVLNEEADEESRQQELRTEWVLNRQDFKFVVEKLGFIVTVDLFASYINPVLQHLTEKNFQIPLPFYLNLLRPPLLIGTGEY